MVYILNIYEQNNTRACLLWRQKDSGHWLYTYSTCHLKFSLLQIWKRFAVYASVLRLLRLKYHHSVSPPTAPLGRQMADDSGTCFFPPVGFLCSVSEWIQCHAGIKLKPWEQSSTYCSSLSRQDKLSLSLFFFNPPCVTNSLQHRILKLIHSFLAGVVIFSLTSDREQWDQVVTIAFEVTAIQACCDPFAGEPFQHLYHPSYLWEAGRQMDDCVRACIFRADDLRSRTVNQLQQLCFCLLNDYEGKGCALWHTFPRNDSDYQLQLCLFRRRRNWIRVWAWDYKEVKYKCICSSFSYLGQRGYLLFG